MEEKNGKKMVQISLGTAVCLAIIFILVIALIGVIFYYNMKDNKNSTETSANIAGNTIVENVKNSTVKESNTTSNNRKEFSNEQVKESFQKYLDLLPSQYASEHGVIGVLGLEKEYKEYEVVEGFYGDPCFKTDIKYSDFKDTILKLITQKLYEKEFMERYRQDENGFLLVKSWGASGFKYKVTSVEKKSDKAYSAKVKWYGLEDDVGTDTNWEFKIEEYNGKCVIDEVNQIK